MRSGCKSLTCLHGTVVPPVSRAHLSHSLDHLRGTWEPRISAWLVQAGETVRHTVGGAGVRCWKKRRPSCNGVDTGSRFARPEREQTSSGYPVARRLREPHQGRKANEHGFGQCVHLPPKGVVAVRVYRKVDRVNTSSAGGPTRAYLCGCLSGVTGNCHAPFLGGKGAVTPLTYPVGKYTKDRICTKNGTN